MTTPHINTAPATLDACFTEFSRLGDLRETGRLTDAEYYALDARLTARIAELVEEQRAEQDVDELAAEWERRVAQGEVDADERAALREETEADIELAFGGLLQDPDASAERVNAAMAEWRSVKGYTEPETPQREPANRYEREWANWLARNPHVKSGCDYEEKR